METLRKNRHKMAKILQKAHQEKAKKSGVPRRPQKREAVDPIWQRKSTEGSRTLGVVESYVRFQSLFLGGSDYVGEDEDSVSEDDADEEPELLATTRSKGRPPQAPLPSRQDRELAEQAKKDVLRVMAPALLSLRKAILVSHCVRRWKDLVRRARVKREVEMRKKFLEDYTRPLVERQEAQEARGRRSVLKQFEAKLPEAEARKLYRYEEDGDAGGGRRGAKLKAGGGDVGGVGSGGGGGGGAGDYHHHHLQDGHREDGDKESHFPQLQLRPLTSPRYPRLDVANQMAAVPAEVYQHFEKERMLNDEMERYRRDRAFHRSAQSNVMITSEGGLSDKAFKPAKINPVRSRILREAEEGVHYGSQTSARPATANPGSSLSTPTLSRLPPRPPSAAHLSSRSPSGFGSRPSSAGQLRSARMADPRNRPRPETIASASIHHQENDGRRILDFHRKATRSVTPQGRFRSPIGNYS